MSNKNKRKERILRTLNNGEIWTINDIHAKTNISKLSISTDLLALKTERKVMRIRDEMHNGYKILR